MSLGRTAADLLLRLRRDPLLRNSAIYLTASLAAGFLGYVYHFETGRLLGPAQYAVVAAAIAGLSLLTLPAIVLQFVSARFTSVLAARGRDDEIRPFLVRVSGLSLIAALPVAGLVVLAAPTVARSMNLPDQRVIYLLAAAAVLTLLTTVNRGALQGLGAFFALSGNTVLDMAGRLVLAGAFIALGFGVLGAVAAVLIGPAIAYVQGIWLLRSRTVRRRVTAGAARVEGLASYALLASFAGVGVNFLFSIDTLLAKRYLSSSDAGIYAAASVLARVVFFLGLTVSGVMFPEVAGRHARDEDHLHIVDRSLALLCGIGALLVAVYLLLPGLVLLPYGSHFIPVKPYLGPFAVALTLLAVSNLLISYFLSVAQGRFIIPLLVACGLEPLLITLFHANAWQILGMVLVALAVLCGSLTAMYVVEHLRVRGAPSNALD